jgi:hypothetical protein
VDQARIQARKRGDFDGKAGRGRDHIAVATARRGEFAGLPDRSRRGSGPRHGTQTARKLRDEFETTFNVSEA